MSTELDPLVAAALADLTNDDILSPTGLRVRLLTSVRRPFAPIRQGFVQQPRGASTRAATLSKLVKAGNSRALDLELLALALEPVLDGTPLPNSTWAMLLQADGGTKIPTTGISKAWNLLEDKYRLIERGTRVKKLANVIPLREDGSGEPYSRPGIDAKGTTGYFILPHAYWIDGWDQKLSLSAKAMLLVHLAATQQSPTLCMSYEHAANWYGISERTAERGIIELRQKSLLDQRGQKVFEPRSPTRETIRYHRFLLGTFSTLSRRKLQQKTRKETRARQNRKGDQESA